MAYDLVAPESDLLLSRDWSAWLPTGRAISTSTWSITPSGPTVTPQATVGAVTTASVTGMTAGSVYCLTNEVTHDGTPAETDSYSWALRCEKR